MRLPALGFEIPGSTTVLDLKAIEFNQVNSKNCLTLLCVGTRWGVGVGRKSCPNPNLHM